MTLNNTTFPKIRVTSPSFWLLAIGFVLSFAQYFVGLSVSLQITPVAFVLVSGLFGFLNSCRLRTVGTDVVAIAPLVGATIITTASSAAFGGSNSALYGILLITVIVSARFIIRELGILGVLASYYVSSIVSLAVLFALAGADILGSAHGGTRLAAFSFHPNLIAFIMGSYVIMHIWVWRANRKLGLISLPFAFSSFVVCYAAKSRGSLGAVVAGFLAAFVVLIARTGWRAVALTRKRLIVIGASLLIAVSLFPFVAERTDAFYSTMRQSLELDSKYRGLQTGLTGRVGVWDRSLDTLRDGSWLLGHGFRRSYGEMGDIDNGYLVSVFEAGILTTLVVCTLYIRLFLHTARIALHEKAGSARLLAECICCLLAVFLTNNFVARYLFGMGNPFSLLALFFLVMRRADLAALQVSHRVKVAHRTLSTLKAAAAG